MKRERERERERERLVCVYLQFPKKGVISHTGVAGLTLGGGIGWLCRTFGLTVDSVLSIDIVTSNGEFLTANNELNQVPTTLPSVSFN